MTNAILLSLQLAFTTTAILLALGVPIAWWLSRKRSWGREVVAALVTLPLVLPPTVLGFYLLLLLSPTNTLGQTLAEWFGGPLTFTFSGLVIGSVIFSLPFMVLPVRAAFEAIGPRPLEVAATLRASPLDTFFSVVLPMARSGLVIGATMTFVHTLGEFGVVLMIGGNIPGETQVLSIAIYNYVETLEWYKAHQIAAGMVVFALVVMLLLSKLNKQPSHGGTIR
ncbi:molybdate ABC transporter permease subunit [Neptunomonas phycophila]|uniref:molybdate ABC transporter permease subunit n=1 Tax=Neptunomonas phycophila TaxID=1572645 RepID=UPI0026E3A792|nr:molybdate ABC transporter permease subunit [Neptunomonas phycophila]MDO6468102.1 molybdate ABC transporter permease subunit [Neptunomonas phycophila]